MPERQGDNLIHVASRQLGQAGQAIVDVVLPPHELLGLSGDPHAKRLWNDVTFLDAPWCKICGFPFEYDAMDSALCGRCSIREPKYDHARAAMAYDDGSRALILSFKHGGRTEGLKSFAAQMRRAGRDILDEADILIPVPLHPTRLIKRRYNQATLLAHALAKICDANFDPDILKRIKRTESQGKFKARQRFQNVKGAFAVREKALPRIQGKHIVIIDDVFTTGATLESCATILKRAGARRVDGICLARVAKAAEIPK